MNKVKPFDVHHHGVTHVIVEMFGGDNNLNNFVVDDMQEMEDGMSGDQAALCLADFIDKPAQVIEVTAGGRKVIEEWGEIDTGDPKILALFLTRALASYPKKTQLALGFWDHGTGVFGEYDPNEHIMERGGHPRVRRDLRSRPERKLFVGKLSTKERAMLHDDTNGGVLTNREAGAMLGAAFKRAGSAARRLPIIFSDTCLNGMVEVLCEFQDFAEVCVASEDLEPGDGWDYTLWLNKTAANPPADGAAWGGQAVEAYEEAYRNRPGLHPCTMGAFRTKNGLEAAFKKLIQAVHAEGDDGFRWMRDARDFSQSFNVYASTDLLDFAQNLKELATADKVKDKAEDLAQAFKEARVASTAMGNTVANAHGLAFWFPPSKTALLRDAETYQYLLFDRKTGWSAYLRKHYGA